MPFHIDYDGQAPISTYMKVSSVKRGVGMPDNANDSGGLGSGDVGEKDDIEMKTHNGLQTDRYISTFRGRTIHGIHVPLPSGYTGLVLKRSEGGNNNSSSSRLREEEEAEVKGRSLRSRVGGRSRKAESTSECKPAEDTGGDEETSRVTVTPSGMFTGLRVWHADIPVDGGRDEYMRSLGEWTALASEMHRGEAIKPEKEGVDR